MLLEHGYQYHIRKILFIFLSVIVFSFLSICLHSGCALASEVTLEWDLNSESDVEGYKVYYGTQSSNYSKVIDVGDWNSRVIQGLEPGTRYYFSVTAYNAYYESDFSEEIDYTVPLSNEAPIADASNDKPSDDGEEGGSCFIHTLIP